MVVHAFFIMSYLSKFFKAIYNNAIMKTWNPARGCTKKSAGCLHCYAEQFANRFWKGGFTPQINAAPFNVILSKRRYPPGEAVFVMSGSDFWHPAFDEYRGEWLSLITERGDLRFMIPTKRPENALKTTPVLPDNLEINVTMENQAMADERIPYLVKIKAAQKAIIAEPLLERVDFSAILSKGEVGSIVAGGESGAHARPCRLEWIQDLYDQCVKYDVNFTCKQCGAHFFDHNGRVYPRSHADMWDVIRRYDKTLYKAKRREYIGITMNTPEEN
jgi:protein gp37